MYKLDTRSQRKILWSSANWRWEKRWEKLNFSSSVPIIKDTTSTMEIWLDITKNNNANIFYNYFSSVANHLKNKAKPIKDFVWGSPVEITSRTDKEFNFQFLPKIFIERELRSLNRNKVTGIDDLNVGLLKGVPLEIAATLLFVINWSLQAGIVPSNWKMTQVTPLYKQSDKTKASNYRPISILPILPKIRAK